MALWMNHQQSLLAVTRGATHAAVVGPVTAVELELAGNE